jgi:hypothetical protein
VVYNNRSKQNRIERRKQMDKMQIKEVRGELQEAMNSVAARHGWKITIGNISYSDTSMRTKLEVLFDESATQREIDNVWQRIFPEYKAGAILEIDGDRVEIVKWNKNGSLAIIKNSKPYHITNRTLRNLHYGKKIKVLNVV